MNVVSLSTYSQYRRRKRMKKTLLRCSGILALVILLGIAGDLAVAQTGDVEFRVNMRIKMLEGTFQPGSGDIVTVPGSFNSWSTTVDTLKDLDGDSIYTKIITIPTGAIQYKFYKTLRGGIDWEGDPNREYTVVAGSQQLPVVYFDRDTVYNPPAANVPVTFQVNMRVKMLEGTFLPGSGDIVTVPGSMNGWSTAADTLRDPNNDSIYTKTLTLMEGQQIFYKFYKTPRGGLDWEGDPNREYTVPTGGGTIPVVYFNRDSIVNTPITANILWQIDMTAFEQLGWFRPDLGDTMQVRGSINGWGGTVLSQNPFNPNVYEVVLPYSGTSFDELPHKFFIDMDSASAVTRFPDYNLDQDGHRYEHPYERGDGNRLFNVGTGGNIETPLYWYTSINPNGVLLNTTDSVTVRFRVNMGPATREAGTPFNYATDTAKFEFMDYLQVSNQKRIQGSSYAKVRNMTRLSPTDSVYEVSVLLVGKAHYGLLYRYRYSQPGGNSVEEGAGLGAQGGYRTRYIQPLSPNTFPRTYNAPQDSWQKNPPLPAETAPFPILVGVFRDDDLSQPSAYQLLQNYPNPFNPATTIKYTIPQRTQVSLKVFNLLGQEVASLVNEEQAAGHYVAQFEANNLASGVYFYRLQAGTFSQVKKMVFVK